jgi:hypothetical protein
MNRVVSPLRPLGRALGGVALLSGALVGTANAFLTFGLPLVLNRDPGRLEVRYRSAWMVVPGHLHVSGLRVDVRGAADHATLSAERIEGTVALGALRGAVFSASEVVGSGISFTYDRRADRGRPLPARRGGGWTLELTDVTLADVRSVRVGDYHLRGTARVRDGSLALRGPAVDAAGRVELSDVAAARGDDPLAQHVRGDLALTLVGFDRTTDTGLRFLERLWGRASLEGEIESLSFLDFYLTNLPWLVLAGTGHFAADLALDRGQVSRGSELRVTVPEMSLGVSGWEVAGDCRVLVDVGSDPILPGSRVVVDFRGFTVTAAGGAGPLVRGEGFRVTARSPDTTLDLPFTTVDVVLELPESQVPGLAAYDALLPSDAGVWIGGGSGTVSGRMVASTTDDSASGELWLHVVDAEARIGDVRLRGDVRSHAQLTGGRVEEGTYDLVGSTVDLSGVSVRSDRQPGMESEGWTASLVVSQGRVAVEVPRSFDAHLGLRCRDSAPFLTLFADQRPLPLWVRDLLTTQDVRGTAHLSLSAGQILLPSLVIDEPRYEVQARLRRGGAGNASALFLRLGALSVGIGSDGDAHHVQVLGAREWFESGGPAGPAPVRRAERPAGARARAR